MRSRLSQMVLASAVAVASSWVVCSMALAAPPETPVTKPATTITATSATLAGELNPLKSATTGYEFMYSQTGNCAEGSTTQPGPEATGKEIPVTRVIEGLTPNTTYTFCVVATHEEGGVVETSPGAPLTFTTLSTPPKIFFESAEGITASGAVLEAAINPENEPTTSCLFEYGTTVAYGVSVPCEPPTFEGSGFGFPAAHLSGLEAATTYHFRLLITNATGPAEGEDQTFTTHGKPVITNTTTVSVTRTTAVVSASINPQGATSTYHVVYIDQDGYEAAVAEGAVDPYAKGGRTETHTIEQENSPQEVSTEIKELRPGTSYDYALVAENTVGTATGPNVALVTSPPTPPLASTNPASEVGLSGASVSGAVDTRGLPSLARFEIGTTESGGSLVPPASFTSTAPGVLALTVRFEHLQPSTTYYVRMVAEGADGAGYGAWQSFTTAALPLTLSIFPSPAPIPYLPISRISADEAATNKSLSTIRARRLQKALKACKRKPRRTRAICQRRAHRAYGFG